MSFLGGIGGSLFSSISQIALGVMTGGMSLVAQFALSIVSQVVQQAIQQVGQQLGLPQGVIDMAKGAFQQASGLGAMGGVAGGLAGAIAGAAQQFNLTPTQNGELQRAADKGVNDIAQQAILQRAQEGREDEEGNKTSGASRNGSKLGAGSWLRALAESLGKKLNAAAEQLKETSDSINWKDPKQASDYQADVQLFNMLMNTINTAIRTIGEGLTTAARKQ